MDEQKKDWNDPGQSHETMTRSGEDVSRTEDEAGREDTGAKESGRPTGTSTARDYTGVDPKDPIDGGSPAG